MSGPEGFKPGDGVLADHPHPAFDEVSRSGYTLVYRITPCAIIPGQRELEVQAIQCGKVAAGANFTDNGWSAYCQNVRVFDGHRRRGLANAMYVFAEKALGRILFDYWADADDYQSDAAKALWSQPNRPFGNPTCPRNASEELAP